MNTARFLSLAAAASLAAFTLGCGPGGGDTSSGGGSYPDDSSSAKKPKVAFISNGVASFWTIAAKGVEAGGQQFNADVEVIMPQDLADQKQKVEDLLIRGFEGMAISPIDPANQTDLLNKAAERCKLITQDSDAPESNRLCYIGMDNYKAGRMCGELVKEALPNGGTIMILVGRMEQDNAKRRRQGVIDEVLGRDYNPSNFDPPNAVLKNDKYQILGTLTDQFDRARAKGNAEDTLAKYPDIGCMVGLFAYNPPAAVEALKAAGKLGRVQIVAFDEDDATLQGIQDGHVHGTVVQNPYEYGRKSVEVLVELTKENNSVIPEGGFIDIPARQIRKDNVVEFWDDLKTKVGEG